MSDLEDRFIEGSKDTLINITDSRKRANTWRVDVRMRPHNIMPICILKRKVRMAHYVSESAQLWNCPKTFNVLVQRMYQ